MIANNANVTVGESVDYHTSAVDTSGAEYSVNGNPDQSSRVRNASIAYISNLPESVGELVGLKAGTTQVTSTFIYDGVVYSTSRDVTVVTP